MSTRVQTSRLLVPALALLAGGLAAAETAPPAPPTLREAITGGKPSVFLRARHEHVEAANFPNDANASTLRAALGYGTRPWQGLSAFLQYEGVVELGDERYNSTNNGRTGFPTVVDQTGSNEFQQVFATYAPSFVERSALKAGRQEILLDNQRFVGNVGWRQDWQTFDAVAVTSSWYKPVTVFYAYLDEVHRIVPEDAPAGEVESDSHLVNVAYTVPEIGKLTGYAYLLDFDRTTTAFLVQSTATYGARAAGGVTLSKDWSVPFQVEYAQQSDWAENPVAQDNQYGLAEIGIAWTGIALKAGMEVLEGQDRANDRFTTPLATLHAFNGWADLFLNTPNAGLRDAWVTIGGPVKWVDGLSFAAFYHDFSSDNGDVRFGDEIDLQLLYQVKPLDPNLTLGVKYADYRADEGEGATIPGSALNVDTTKTWVWAQYAF